MTTRFILIATLVLLAIAPEGVAQKFHADDPLPRDNDKAINVTAIPKYKLNDQYDFLQHSFGSPGDRRKTAAVNVNTLGEVPDSSWFQNRHGMKPMSLSELAQGPNTGNGPSMDQPWTVVEAKTEGVTPGFRIRDARGDVYVIKFDPLDYPELATAAEMISTKFFYAIGFSVPENYISFFSRNQLRIDSSAKLSEVELDNLLKRVPQRPDGTYRALASKLLAGTSVGPFQYFGTRPDDPNDIFAHENRRELRGFRVFAAWLNHDDSRSINSLDMLVNESGKQYVKHHLIDFGSTLGSGSTGPQKARAGSEYLWEPKAAFVRILTLGLWDRKWIRSDRDDAYPSIGIFQAKDFEPKEWKPEYPNPAFSNMTPQDAYWAAKIVMAFSRDEIQAIVETGKISDPKAEEYLVETIVQRRDKVGRSWLLGLSSVDKFEWTPAGELKFAHLASDYDFVPRPEFKISWFSFDNTKGDRKPISQFDPKNQKGYFAAVISSVEGQVEVYFRAAPGQFQTVGVERR